MEDTGKARRNPAMVRHRRTFCSPSSLFSIPGVICRLGMTALLLSMCACGGNSRSSTVSSGSYMLTAAALNPGSITAGGTSSSAITVTPAAGYSGSVALSCAGPSGCSAPTCSISPSQVTVSSGTPGSSTLTVSTTSNTPGGTYAVSVTGKDGNSMAPSNGAQALSLVTAAVIQH